MLPVLLLMTAWVAGAGLAAAFLGVTAGEQLIVTSLAIVWNQLAWIHKAILESKR